MGISVNQYCSFISFCSLNYTFTICTIFKKMELSFWTLLSIGFVYWFVQSKWGKSEFYPKISDIHNLETILCSRFSSKIIIFCHLNYKFQRDGWCCVSLGTGQKTVLIRCLTTRFLALLVHALKGDSCAVYRIMRFIK